MVKKTAAIIARVSTSIQNFDRQLTDLKALAESQGYHVPDDLIYAEKISGLKKNDDRAELNRLEQDVDNGKKIDMIFVSEVSRISRVPLEGAKFLEGLVDKGIPVFIQSMNMASIKDGVRNMNFFLIMGILIEFAGAELTFTKTRIASGRKQKFSEGRNTGGDKMVYGYISDKKVDEKAAGKLIINPTEAEVVRNVFELYNAGSGMVTIARKLNADGVKTRTGTPWSISTVNQMLKNKIYYGSRDYFTTKVDTEKSTAKIIVTYKEKETFEGIVPAIITKDVWDLAQLSASARNINPERNVKYLYLLANGKAQCGYCTQGYQAKFRPKKHSHYMCGTRYRGGACAGAGIGIDKIESLAWAIVKLNLGIFAHIYNNSTEKKKIEAEIKKMEIKVDGLEYDINSKLEEKRKWSKLFTKGLETETAVDAEHARLNTIINNLRLKLEGIKEEVTIKKRFLNQFDDLKSYKKLVKEIGVDRVKINQILPQILDKLIITSVTTDRLSDEFVVSAFVYGHKDEYLSFLFNKRTLRMHTTINGADKLIKYTPDGVADFDMDAVVKSFKSLHKEPSTGQVMDLSSIIDHVPFTRLNMLDELQPV